MLLERLDFFFSEGLGVESGGGIPKEGGISEEKKEDCRSAIEGGVEEEEEEEGLKAARLCA